MTPNKLLFLSLLFFSVLTTSLASFADPDWRNPGRGHHHGDDRRGPPRHYFPDNDPYPPAPSQPAPIVRSIWANRWLTNETMPVGSILGLPNDPSFNVDFVEIDIRGGAADLRILLNGFIADTRYSASGIVRLYPQQRMANAGSLQLQVSGNVFVQEIRVFCRVGNGGGYNPPPSYPGPGEIRVPMNVSRHMFNNDRIDLNMYGDLNRYRGYRLIAVEITARASFNNAFLNLFINGFNAGDTLYDQFLRTQVIFPNGANPVLGNGINSLVLMNRGEIDLQGVTLRLAR